MRPQKIKNRCVKRQSIKAEGVIRAYDRIQEAFLDVLEKVRVFFRYRPM